MRSNSQRVPNKNLRHLHDKPLYHYVIKSLLKAESVHQVWVNTESQEIEESVRSDFPTVMVFRRDADLAQHHTSMDDVLADFLTHVPCGALVQTHSTSPFLSSNSIDRAVRALQAARHHDSLFSVTMLQARLWTQDGKPLNHDVQHLVPTQLLPPIFLENSALYVFYRDEFLERRTRIGKNPIMYTLPLHESVDIDTEDDFKFAQLLAESSAP